MTKERIVFIIPYFGRWPFWMPLFLKSCRFNPQVNWLLYGDCGRPNDLPSNVSYVHLSFEEYCQKVSQRLGVQFKPRRAYKLCDLKPALGFVHEEEIQEFDFWGFSDIDVIYGQLRDYFNSERLAKYNFFSTHERRVSGHLCLMRNNVRMRTAFQKIPNYYERLCDEHSHALDEGAFTRIFLWRKNFPKPLFRFVGLFNKWRRSAIFEELYSTPNAGRPWMDGTKNFPACWYWREGVLTTNKTGERAFPYLHFYGWKGGFADERYRQQEHEIADIGTQDGWIIDATGFRGF